MEEWRFSAAFSSNNEWGLQPLRELNLRIIFGLERGHEWPLFHGDASCFLVFAFVPAAPRCGVVRQARVRNVVQRLKCPGVGLRIERGIVTKIH